MAYCNTAWQHDFHFSEWFIDFAFPVCHFTSLRVRLIIACYEPVLPILEAWFSDRRRVLSAEDLWCDESWKDTRSSNLLCLLTNLMHTWPQIFNYSIMRRAMKLSLGFLAGVMLTTCLLGPGKWSRSAAHSRCTTLVLFNEQGQSNSIVIKYVCSSLCSTWMSEGTERWRNQGSSSLFCLPPS